VVNVALPAIADKLDAGLAGQQWVVEAYMLTLVALLLVGGSLGDQFGRRRIFVLGLIGFAATSILCALAPTVEVLVAGRALQGIAGALLVPGSLALVASTFEGAARGKAVGTWTAWTGIAVVIGPAGGGALVEALSWRAIFWINVPLIAFTVALTLRAVAESRDPEAFHGADVPGILLSALGLGAPVFALMRWITPLAVDTNTDQSPSLVWTNAGRPTTLPPRTIERTVWRVSESSIRSVEAAATRIRPISALPPTAMTSDPNSPATSGVGELGSHGLWPQESTPTITASMAKSTRRTAATNDLCFSIVIPPSAREVKKGALGVTGHV